MDAERRPSQRPGFRGSISVPEYIAYDMLRSTDDMHLGREFIVWMRVDYYTILIIDSYY